VGNIDVSSDEKLSSYEKAVHAQWLRRDIGKNIKERREALGMTVGELSKRTGVSCVRVEKVEQGEAIFALEEIQMEILIVLERVEDFRDGVIQRDWHVV
jgi:predicted transcriptional regulator